MSSERVSFSVNDEELAEFLDGVENKSEVIRSALRREMYQTQGVDDPRLTEDQVVAYEWLRRYAGVGESVQFGVVRTVLAQTLSLDKGLVKLTVIQPLERLGYIEVTPRMHDVQVVVRPPVAVDGVEGELEVDDPAEASERLDELVAAQTGVPADD